MSKVWCDIPADMLRYTVSALDDLAIRQQMQAEKPGVAAPAAAELLEQAAKARETANFYHKKYMQHLFPETRETV